MANEGKQEVVEEVQPINPDAEGKVTLAKDEAGHFPAVVPWHKYVGIKEKFTRVETELRGKVSGLEERLKTAVGQEEHNKVKVELETLKGKLTQTETELTQTKAQTLKDKRAALTARGIPEATVLAMNEQALDGAMLVLQHGRPGPDMGNSGMLSEVKSSRERIRSGFDALHPKG